MQAFGSGADNHRVALAFGAVSAERFLRRAFEFVFVDAGREPLGECAMPCDAGGDRFAQQGDFGGRFDHAHGRHQAIHTRYLRLRVRLADGVR